MNVLSNWNLIELDFDRMGHDLEPLLDQRTWRWFTLRLSMLIGNPESMTHKALIKKEDNGAEAE